MIEMMQEAGLHFGIMHNYLFMPHFMLAHQLIQQGVIGKLRHMSLQWMNMRINPGNDHYNRHWRHDFQESGGGFCLISSMRYIWPSISWKARYGQSQQR